MCRVLLLKSLHCCNHARSTPIGRQYFSPSTDRILRRKVYLTNANCQLGGVIELATCCPWRMRVKNALYQETVRRCQRFHEYPPALDARYIISTRLLHMYRSISSQSKAQAMRAQVLRMQETALKTPEICTSSSHLMSPEPTSR